MTTAEASAILNGNIPKEALEKIARELAQKLVDAKETASTVRDRPAFRAAAAAVRFSGSAARETFRFSESLATAVLHVVLRTLGECLFFLEAAVRKYRAGRGYVADEQFDQKIERGRIILMGYGLQNVKKITLREICREFGVSDWYARQIREVAMDPIKYFSEYKEYMASYVSDSEKNDKRTLSK